VLSDLPEYIENEDQLEELLSRPSPALVEQLAKLDDDIIVLGAGGKMGPSLARMAKRALDEAGNPRDVIAVSRFTSPQAEHMLNQAGVHTLPCDLLDPDQLAHVPHAQNVIYMVGRKFGSTGAEGLTWAMNCWLAGQVARAFHDSRIVAFSTGNVYPLVPVRSGGSKETDPLDPIGEYSQSCVGRERMFEHFSSIYGTPVLLFRLNYAVEMRYGVLLDVAQRVAAGQPVDVTTGHFNLIWQGEANERALRCLALCECPPRLLNVTCVEVHSVRRLAERFGEVFGREVKIVGKEAPTAFFSDARQAARLLGPPQMPIETLIRWIAHWVRISGPTLNKPTHFEQREGKY
jgi:dTDP-4-dehydrorhamnose reductase